MRTRIAEGPSTKVNVTVFERLRQFPGEDFVDDCGKLYCGACHADVSPKKSNVTAHIATQRHKRGKEPLCRKRQRQETVLRSFVNYQEEKGKDLSGTGLSKTFPADVSLRRVEAATAFLKSGVPSAKLPCLRGLLEEGHVRWTDPNHLSQLAEFILQDEKKNIKAEIAHAEHCTVIFNGNSKLGEALVIILRYVDSEWNIQQRVIRLKVLAKSLNGQELA